MNLKSDVSSVFVSEMFETRLRDRRRSTYVSAGQCTWVAKQKSDKTI